jgi:hypothetical protein
MIRKAKSKKWDNDARLGRMDLLMIFGVASPKTNDSS